MSDNLFHTFVFTFNPREKIYHNFIKQQKPGFIELAINIFVVLLIVDFFFKPFVNLINYSVFVAKMINKLYHAKKLAMHKGVNKIAAVKSVNPNKKPLDIIKASMNQRESLKISWLDVFIYKYLKFNCYRIHKGSKFYKGKIIYEGEQKLKNDADLGNIISNVRKSKVMVQSLLDRDTYTYLKYQQCKFIDVVDTPNAKFTDLNS